MFQQILQTLGNMDGQYQVKTLVTAFITDVKNVEYSQKTGKPGQSLYLRHDETGEISWVKFIGKGVEDSPLDKTDKGTTRDFLVWPFKPDQSPKTCLYCWIQRQTSQSPQQAPQQAAQGTNAPQGGEVVFSQCRALAIDIAAKLVASGKHAPVELYGLADFITDYIRDGKHPTGVASANPPGTMDGSPMDDFPQEPGSQG